MESTQHGLAEEPKMNERIDRLERRVWLLTSAVAALSLAIVYLCLPEWVTAAIRSYAIAAVPVTGFLMIAGLITLVLIHRQIPAIAREVGRWFAPLQ